jgi:hypothetical protein
MCTFAVILVINTLEIGAYGLGSDGVSFSELTSMLAAIMVLFGMGLQAFVAGGATLTLPTDMAAYRSAFGPWPTNRCRENAPRSLVVWAVVASNRTPD